MNVSLSVELEKFVREKVASGHYTSASEVVRDGLRLLVARDQLAVAQVAELRRKIDEGLRDAREGRVSDGRVAFAALRKKSRERRTRA